MEGLKHYLWALNTVKTKTQGLPGGSMVKNPPASAGDAGSIPDLGSAPAHMLQSS